MKKVLLFLAAVAMCGAASYGQVAEPIPSRFIDDEATVATEDIATEIVDEAVLMRAPRKTVVQASSGVFYRKPVGTYYQTGTSSGNKYCYNVVPMFTDVEFINCCDDHENAQWSVNKTANAANEAGNLVKMYQKATGNGAWYAPSISVETDTFTMGRPIVAANRALIVNRSEVNSVCYVDRNAGYYTGFTTYNFFGTHTGTTSGVEYRSSYLRQPFDKPAAPMYMTGVWFNVKSFTGTPIAEGASATFYLYTVNGSSVDKILVNMPITSENFTLTKANDDGSCTGTIELPFETPIIVDQAFSIEIHGFDNEGVEFGIYMTTHGLDTNLGADSYKLGGTYPTVVTGYSTDGNNTRYNVWKYNSSTGNQYNAVIFFDMMWDVARVDNISKALTAPAEGGTLDHLIQFRSTFKISEGTYSIQGIPEWLSISGVSENNYDSSFYNLIQLTAEPNMTGETRTATLRIISELGAKSADMVVTQESIPMRTISGVVMTAGADTPGAPRYATGDPQPIEGADVVISKDDDTYNATTDAEGKFNLLVPVADGYTIKVTKDGYVDYEADLDVEAGDEPMPLEITLTNTPTGVQDINAGKVVANVKYVNVAGQESSKPMQGVNVKVVTYTDGTKAVVKEVR